MTYTIAILCGLVVGGLLGFGVGLGAAIVFADHYGSNSGGTDMAGFLFIGPFGLIGGFLLGTGAYLRFSLGPKPLSTGLFKAAGIVLFLGLVSFLFPLLKTEYKRRTKADFYLLVEFEVPSEFEIGYKELESYRWVYSGVSQDESASSLFYTQHCLNGRCVLSSELQMVDNTDRRFVIFEHKSQRETFPIPLVGMIQKPTQWPDWQQRKDLRFRWMMKKIKSPSTPTAAP